MIFKLAPFIFFIYFVYGGSDQEVASKQLDFLQTPEYTQEQLDFQKSWLELAIRGFIDGMIYKYSYKYYFFLNNESVELNFV